MQTISLKRLYLVFVLIVPGTRKNTEAKLGMFAVSAMLSLKCLLAKYRKCPDILVLEGRLWRIR